MSQGAPWRVRVDRRFPALSSRRGHSPTHDRRWPGVGKAPHLHANLGHQRAGDQMAHAGHRTQAGRDRVKRADELIEPLIDGTEAPPHRRDLVQVEPQQEAMVVPDAPLQGGAQTTRIRLQPSGRPGQQLVGVRLALDEATQQRAPTHPAEVTDDARDLDVGIFQGLLQPQGMLRDLGQEEFDRRLEHVPHRPTTTRGLLALADWLA